MEKQSLISRLRRYQYERFPLRLLVFASLASVLASTVIASQHLGIIKTTATFLVMLFFLFHIRVLDESRDLAYDYEHYPNRPIQKGIVSMRELWMVDVLGLSFILVVGFYYGFPSTVWCLAMFLFTALAWKNFFTRSSVFSGHPLRYHIINSPQMIMLQLFIFAVITETFYLTREMWLLLLFAYINVFILEIVRKIKLGGEGITDENLYSQSLGFRRSIATALLFIVATYVVFALILLEISAIWPMYLTLGSAVVAAMISSLLWHMLKKKPTSERLMLSLCALGCVGLNILIYLSA